MCAMIINIKRGHALEREYRGAHGDLEGRKGETYLKLKNNEKL